MNPKYHTDTGKSGYFNIQKDNILDYSDDAGEFADAFFADNGLAEFFSVCVFDFETRKSVIFEFTCEKTISCTAY